MPYLVTVEIWGPETGCELELDMLAREAEEATRLCAERGLHASLPGASVTHVAVAREARKEGERLRPGYRVALTISAPEPLSRLSESGERWLRFWVESEVSVALLELINPMTVDAVSVTPPAGGRGGRLEQP